MEAVTRSYLRSLAAGTITAEEAAEWALRMMDSDAPELRDERIWTALDRLSGADLMVGPGEYMHGQEDFDSWVAEFGDGNEGS
ncbi:MULTISPECIES: DNA-binding protein [Streptomyces]|uniref:DNA-binding protein n=1 Tax=Streptomyces lutosisoli TaxID=2665721 RepID=A0ABW2VEW3_9ACTN